MVYQHIVDAWNSGKTKKQIAEEFNISEKSVIVYLNEAKKNNIKLREKRKDEIPERQYEIVARLWNQGLTESEIASELNKSPVTIKTNLREARLRGIELIKIDQIKTWKKYEPSKRKKFISTNESKRVKNIGKSLEKEELLRNYVVVANENTERHIQEKISSILESNFNLSEKIIELLKLKFPIEVAKLLNIKPKVVLDLIDSLPEEEMKLIRKEFIKNRLNIANNIIALQEVGKTPNKALELIDSRIPKELIGELADVYFILNRSRDAISILRRLWTIDYITPAMEEEFQSRILYFESEIKARRIRKEIKKQRAEGKQVSYYSLCKKYKVNENFLSSIVDEEEKDY